MFYYPEVLRRRSGCFATIWLAATCSWRLLPRDYLSVDVPRTCAAVASFVIGRSGWEAPPPPAGAPPPRCSLYLAALLQLGLVRVLGRQCHRLLDDVSQTLERLHRVTPIEPQIDMTPPRGLQQLPGALSVLVSLDWAPDPQFGVMGAGLPSPTDLPQLRRLLEEPLPALAPPEAITLREPGPIEAPPAPEEELPEVTPRELELLAEAEELLPYAPRRRCPIVEEIPELPAPPPAPAPPEEAPPPPKLPPKRRRLPHTDPQPQIPQEQFQAQLLRPHGHCGALVLLEPPPKRLRPPSELLRTPTCGWLPPELWHLWGRCARPAPRRPPAAPEPPSEVEILREVLEPSLPGMVTTSELSLELPEEEPRPLPPEEPRPPPPLPPSPLPELPEAPEPEMPPGPAPNMAAMRRLLLSAAALPGGSDLGSLVPPGTPRGAVGRLLCLCLELCASHWLRLEQSRPYGPIRIQLRPH